ncbi:hypothetical protein KIW84_062477 [Lathyrus oleraceus]|uniref:Uncharacterized protein n=1 Tax=Pisum sativum TaxID=3888 RepID=A0A9D4W5C7_PEA|nr:hypothetical protein KIW84_062477 [Pisum sativum]
MQQKALKALVSIAIVWPNEIAKEGEVTEISKVILQTDPSIPHTLWESVASVLASILQFSSEFYLEIPVAILVRLPQSGSETTVSSGLRALLVLESDEYFSVQIFSWVCQRSFDTCLIFNGCCIEGAHDDGYAVREIFLIAVSVFFSCAGHRLVLSVIWQKSTAFGGVISSYFDAMSIAVTPSS